MPYAMPLHIPYIYTYMNMDLCFPNVERMDWLESIGRGLDVGEICVSLAVCVCLYIINYWDDIEKK